MEHAGTLTPRLRRTNTPTSGSTPAELLMESEVVTTISREKLKEAVFYWFRLGVAQQGGRAQIGQEYALILTKIAYWLHDYLHNRGKRGLMLIGGVGCGKSTAMRALRSTTNRLVELRCRHDYGLTRQLMMGIVSATELSDDRQTDPKMFEADCRRLMLGIDDLGVEITERHSYGDAVRPVEEVIMRRYDNLRTVTVVTTNLTINQLKDKYSARVIDRMREMFLVVSFTGTSSFRK